MAVEITLNLKLTGDGEIEISYSTPRPGSPDVQPSEVATEFWANEAQPLRERVISPGSSVLAPGLSLPIAS